MSAVFLWRSTTPVDIDHIGERDGVRWGRLEGFNHLPAARVPERLAPIPVLSAPRTVSITRRLFAFYQVNARRIAHAFVEDGLDAETALAAYERGGGS